MISPNFHIHYHVTQLQNDKLHLDTITFYNTQRWTPDAGYSGPGNMSALEVCPSGTNPLTLQTHLLHWSAWAPSLPALTLLAQAPLPFPSWNSAAKLIQLHRCWNPSSCPLVPGSNHLDPGSIPLRSGFDHGSIPLHPTPSQPAVMAAVQAEGKLEPKAPAKKHQVLEVTRVCPGSRVRAHTQSLTLRFSEVAVTPCSIAHVEL